MLRCLRPFVKPPARPRGTDAGCCAHSTFAGSGNPPLAEWLVRADTHGVKAIVVASGAAFAGGVGFAALSLPQAVTAVPLAAALLGGAYALRGRLIPALPAASLDASLAQAMPAWNAGRRTALEGMVAEFAGPEYAAHALRCSALAAMLAEQLALNADETSHVTLAAAVHVLPVAYPPAEDFALRGCAFDASSVEAAYNVLARTSSPEVARISAEFRERWDGAGIPARLARESISMGGRIVAAVCAFDHASVAGKEVGLEAVRDGSATAFDPVVVAELAHLFRQPWQQRVAA